MDRQDFGSAHEYMRDAWQRSVLFLDILRQRGNIHQEQKRKSAPHVLDFEFELVLDGRTFERPVNYLLVRIIPPPGNRVDAGKRPFMIVDPRAGHGPGIGGMKDDSQIGAALRNGHPCYFLGFLPEPVSTQTTEDVWNAQAEFTKAIGRLHPSAGKPVIVANCQAGWQTMIMAATHPDVAGPLLLAGSPLSYWAGVRGKNPLRYLGGILGGTWLTTLAGDLGGGKFDGANLVANFEKLDPANTHFDKPYNVYANVDTEAERFLEFETWWGSPVVMNAGEMQWIADNLFVGNKLAIGALRTSDGVQIDLRNIQSPIVIFCSWGDNITPPQQALGWITDVYSTDEELAAGGQTIVYSLHDTVGHLGIFISGKIGTREHDEFASAMEIIDLLPPGLYEAVIETVGSDTANPELVGGKHLFRLVPRTIDDIRGLGGNSPEDDRKFATAARVSEINRRLYETYLGPTVRSLTPPAFGDWARKMHPNRVRFSIFSDENPAMQLVAQAAEKVRNQRQPAGQANVLSAAEKNIAKVVSSTLTAMGAARDAWTEQLFHMTYGSPLLQALVGVDPGETREARRPEQEAHRKQAGAESRADLEAQFDEGGSVAAALRSIIFILRAEGDADERNFAVLKQFYDKQPQGRPLSMAELKKVLRDQSLLLRMDEDRAVAAIPSLLPPDRDERARILRAVHRLALAQGELSAEGKRRLGHIAKLFGGREVKPRKEAVDADG